MNKSATTYFFCALPAFFLVFWVSAWTIPSTCVEESVVLAADETRFCSGGADTRIDALPDGGQSFRCICTSGGGK